MTEPHMNHPDIHVEISGTRRAIDALTKSISAHVALRPLCDCGRPVEPDGRGHGWRKICYACRKAEYRARAAK